MPVRGGVHEQGIGRQHVGADPRAGLAEDRVVDADLDGAWLVISAATPEVNRQVARSAEARRIFVNAVDDVDQASAYAGWVVRRGGATVRGAGGAVVPCRPGNARFPVTISYANTPNAYTSVAGLTRIPPLALCAATIITRNPRLAHINPSANLPGLDGCRSPSRVQRSAKSGASTMTKIGFAA